MKQGILIIGYKDIQHLIDIIEFFNDDEFYYYIHLKKSSKFQPSELERLRSKKGVMLVSQKFESKWGGINILKSILYLSEEALKNKEIEYYHLISSGDFPIKAAGYFKQFLKENAGTEFLDWVTPPDAKFMKRLTNYYPFDFFNVKEKNGWANLYRFVHLQRRLGIKRRLPSISNLAVGSAWFTLTYACLEYVVQYTKKQPALLKRLHYTYCAEEFYFGTVLINSPFHNKLANDNLRYIDWNSRNGSSPVILDESDFSNLISSDKLFARKFENPISAGIVAKLKQHFNQLNPNEVI